jgi:hypothetical protein
MHGRAATLVGLVRDVVQRASAGPLPDQKRVVNNLRYIREQLESMYLRHASPRQAPQEEQQRAQMSEAVRMLYSGLEELEHGLLRCQTERLEAALQTVTTAATMIETLEHSIEDQLGADEGTL